MTPAQLNTPLGSSTSETSVEKRRFTSSSSPDRAGDGQVLDPALDANESGGRNVTGGGGEKQRETRSIGKGKEPALTQSDAHVSSVSRKSTEEIRYRRKKLKQNEKPPVHSLDSVLELMNVFDGESTTPATGLGKDLKDAMEPQLRVFRTKAGMDSIKKDVRCSTRCAQRQVWGDAAAETTGTEACGWCAHFQVLCVHKAEGKKPTIVPRSLEDRGGLTADRIDFWVPPKSRDEVAIVDD